MKITEPELKQNKNQIFLGISAPNFTIQTKQNPNKKLLGRVWTI